MNDQARLVDPSSSETVTGVLCCSFVTLLSDRLIHLLTCFLWCWNSLDLRVPALVMGLRNIFLFVLEKGQAALLYACCNV